MSSVSCPALSSPALPASQPACLSPTGWFSFVLGFFVNKSLFSSSDWVFALFQSPQPWQIDPVGPIFAFRTALILRDIDLTRCWKHSPEILVHIDMIGSRSCCRFAGCTSMMQISRSTTSQRCSIGLRSGDSGGHLSKVNSMSCSRNQSEMIWALWRGALSC